MSYKEIYQQIVSFKSNSTAELHTMLMDAFDNAEKRLGAIEFTREKTIHATYQEFQYTITPLIQKIWHLQHMLSIREQNESKRMIYEKNTSQMMPWVVMHNECKHILNNNYTDRLKEIKELAEIKRYQGDSTLAEKYVREKIEIEEEMERRFLNNVLLRYTADIETCRANIERISDNSSDMY